MAKAIGGPNIRPLASIPERSIKNNHEIIDKRKNMFEDNVKDASKFTATKAISGGHIK